jgi:hypothetical protein
MIKAFGLLRKAPHAGYYEFRDFFRGDFIKAILATAAGHAINRVVAHHVLERDFRPTTNADNQVWSAVAAYYFDDAERALRTIGDPEFLAASAAPPDMVEEVTHTIVNEMPIMDNHPRAGAAKVFAFFKNTLPKGNPMSREEMFMRWNEHAGRMKGHKLDEPMEKFVENQVFLHYHAINPQYDYDGVSEIWFDSVEQGEKLFKSYEAEQLIIPSSAAMGGEPGGCVYLRTDEIEVYRRTD